MKRLREVPPSASEVKDKEALGMPFLVLEGQTMTLTVGPCRHLLVGPCAYYGTLETATETLVIMARPQRRAGKETPCPERSAPSP